MLFIAMLAVLGFLYYRKRGEGEGEVNICVCNICFKKEKNYPVDKDKTIF